MQLHTGSLWYYFCRQFNAVYIAAGDSSAAIFTLFTGKILHFVTQENLRHFLLKLFLIFLFDFRQKIERGHLRYVVPFSFQSI